MSDLIADKSLAGLATHLREALAYSPRPEGLEKHVRAVADALDAHADLAQGARHALEAAKAAMLRTRTASIAGCEEGYGRPERWADELFASHGDLTKAIKLCDEALSAEEPRG